MKVQKVLLLDFGGIYGQFTARKIRECNTYCEVLPFDTPANKIKDINPIAIVLIGFESGANDKGALPDAKIFDLNIPVLAICEGAKVAVSALNKLDKKLVLKNSILEVDSLGNNLYVLNFEEKFFNSEEYKIQIRSFLDGIAKSKGEWTINAFTDNMVAQLKAKLHGKKALCAFSGGVDSAVAATLIHKACPESLTCIFVDHGLLRKYEADEVVKVFKEERGMNLIKVDASKRFLDKLKGVSDPEQKRKIIGAEFIKVFEEEAKKIGQVDFLVQGTIYPDIIESGFGSHLVKSHHNVGGLPDVIDFEEIIEPLKDLFKDEVRACGFELGLPKSVVLRQPFPGPGLGVRVLGEVTEDKLEILRDADYIYRSEIASAGLEYKIWQYFVVMTGLKSVGVKHGKRTYDYTVALRAIHSVDGMTADWARIPYDILEKISYRIATEVEHINRVVYDITPKPPATIEWE